MKNTEKHRPEQAGQHLLHRFVSKITLTSILFLKVYHIPNYFLDLKNIQLPYEVTPR